MTVPTLRHRIGPNKVSIPMVRRMRDLAEAGLSCNAIAAVIELDFGISIHEKTVRTYARPTSGRFGMAHDSSANWGEAVGGREAT